MENYYNSSNGLGFEGLLNYSNTLTDGWFSSIFLLSMWIVMTYVLSKSEWKLTGIVAFSSFVTLMMAMVLKLFTTIPEQVIFILITLIAGSLAWAIIDSNNR